MNNKTATITKHRTLQNSDHYKTATRSILLNIPYFHFSLLPPITLYSNSYITTLPHSLCYRQLIFTFKSQGPNLFTLPDRTATCSLKLGRKWSENQEIGSLQLQFGSQVIFWEKTSGKMDPYFRRFLCHSWSRASTHLWYSSNMLSLIFPLFIIRNFGNLMYNSASIIIRTMNRKKTLKIEEPFTFY